MRAPIYQPFGMENEPRRLVFSYTISFFCHLAFFTDLIMVPDLKPDRKFSQSVIDVSLITLPSTVIKPAASRKDADIAKMSAESKKRKALAISSKATAAKDRKYSNAVSITPKKRKIKKSLKKRTFRSSKVLKYAISRIEKKIEQSRAEPVVKAIDRLKQKIGETDAARNDPGDPGTQDTPEKPQKRALELMDIYKAEIPYYIQKNWVFSEQLAGERDDLVAWLVIEIRPDGNIRDIWFEERSGNRYFDDQAFKAVQKSNPLPPLPEGYSRPYFNVGLRFTPSGLK